MITNRGSFASPWHCRLRRGLERLRARTKCSVRIREAYLELRYLHHQRLRRGAFAIWSQVMPCVLTYSIQALTHSLLTHRFAA